MLSWILALIKGVEVEMASKRIISPVKARLRIATEESYGIKVLNPPFQRTFPDDLSIWNHFLGLVGHNKLQSSSSPCHTLLQ